MKISDRIKSIRVSKQFSQDYMATQLGISQRAYSKLENEEIKLDIEKLQKIAKILEVESGELLSGESNQTNQFSNNKLITNAIVNNYNKMQEGLHHEIIQILKAENESLKTIIKEKDLQIKDLFTLLSK
jgi:transcriptional regulator with XRE-family HTH domain